MYRLSSIINFLIDLKLHHVHHEESFILWWCWMMRVMALPSFGKNIWFLVYKGMIQPSNNMNNSIILNGSKFKILLLLSSVFLHRISLPLTLTIYICFQSFFSVPSLFMLLASCIRLVSSNENVVLILCINVPWSMISRILFWDDVNPLTFYMLFD